MAGWLHETLRTMQDQAIARAEAAGAYALRHVNTRVEPDDMGGITIHYEWEMAVVRDGA